MLKTFFLHPLGPALILLLGGLLLQLGGWRARPSASAATRAPFPVRQKRLEASAAAGSFRPMLRAAISGLTFSQVLTLLALIVVALAAGDLIWLRHGLAGATASSAISAGRLHWLWQPLAMGGSELDWRLDGWNWLVALLLLLLTAATLILNVAMPGPVAPGRGSPDRPILRRIPYTLWLTAAALTFIFSGNVLTLASCWVLLDGALALRMGTNDAEQPAGRAWSLLSLSGLALLIVLLLLGEGGIRFSLTRGPFSSVELGLLWLAALIRAGVYPFHLWLTGREPLNLGDRIALHLIAPLTGLWLLGRVHEVAGPNWLRRPEWAALGALALLGSALAAWTANDSQRRWRWVAINRASLVVMAAYIANTTGPAALAWALVTFALGLALLAAGEAARAAWGWKWPLWLGVLTVWGLPGTPGFLAHSALVLPGAVPSALLFFLLIVVGETLLMASLWQLATSESEAPVSPLMPISQPARLRPARNGEAISPLQWSSLLGFGALVLLLAVPTVGWGLAPRQLGSLLGLPAAADQMHNLFQIMFTARRSVWGVLILSGVAGVVLGLNRKEIFTGMRGWQEGISALVGLEWFYGVIALGFALAGSGLRYFANLGEGEGYLGWLMLAALLLWVLLRG